MAKTTRQKHGCQNMDEIREFLPAFSFLYLKGTEKRTVSGAELLPARREEEDKGATSSAISFGVFPHVLITTVSN